MSDNSCLSQLKEEYNKLEKKYSLPDFQKMNHDFQIEKIAESETDTLLREVRKFIGEKFSSYLRFIEAILNPVNSPMFVFTFIKTLSETDKEKLTDVYKRLAKSEIEHIERDLIYSEEKEAELIKNSYENWQEIKQVLLPVFENIGKNWDNRFETNKRGYFG